MTSPCLGAGTAAAMLCLVCACSDPVAPHLADGPYALLSVDGMALPFLRLATVNCDYSVTGADLTVGPGTGATLDIHESYDCTRTGGQLTIGGRTYPGTYTVQGSAFTLTAPTQGGPPVILHGTLIGDGSSLDIDDPETYAAGPGMLRFHH